MPGVVGELRRAADTTLRLLLRRAAASAAADANAASPSSSATMLLAGSRSCGAQQQQRRAAASSSASPSPPAPRRNANPKSPTGYVWSELMFWHNPGEIGDLASRVQPTRHHEHAETKRRLHNLVALSGLLAAPAGASSSSAPPSGERRQQKQQAGPALVEIEPRMATIAELERAHDPAYVAEVLRKSNDPTASVHRIGDESAFAPGGFEVAALSAGAALTATEAVLSGRVGSAYALSRPPGHHATRATGGGFCLFNNVAVAALHALESKAGDEGQEQEEAALSASSSSSSSDEDDNEEEAAPRRRNQPNQPNTKIKRAAIVDFDVHHGNGTQDIFYEDERVLFVSLHQDGNYPLQGGKTTEVGRGRARGFNVNIPLPPGSGSGCYRGAFDRVVIPALDAFKPDIVLVSAGYDAGYMDPLGQMMLGSHDYRYFLRRLRGAAQRHSRGRLVAVHEGGYSDAYVPFCGLAAIEAMCGITREQQGVEEGKRRSASSLRSASASLSPSSRVHDPYWSDVSNFGYQALQPWQDAAIRACEEGPLALLKAKCEQRDAKEAKAKTVASSSSGVVGRGRTGVARPTVPGGGGGGGAASKALSSPPAATSLPGSLISGYRTSAARETTEEAACG